LAFEIDRRSEEFEIYTRGNNHVPQHTTTKQLTQVFNNRSKTINQSVYAISYHPADQPRYVKKGYNLCMLAPALENKIGIYVHLNTARTDEIEDFVRNNATVLSGIAEEYDMTLRTSCNRLNHPERGMKRYTDSEEIEQVLEDKIGSEYWKRLYFGWNIDIGQQADDILAEASDRTAILYRLFFDSPDRLEDSPGY